MFPSTPQLEGSETPLEKSLGSNPNQSGTVVLLKASYGNEFIQNNRVLNIRTHIAARPIENMT